MSNKMIQLAMLEPTGKETIEVKVSYLKGGVKYYDYTRHPRGYWLQVTPLEIEHSECGNFKMTKYLFGSGKKYFVSEASRFSQKALERAAAPARDMMDAAVSLLCDESGYTLAEASGCDLPDDYAGAFNEMTDLMP